MRTEKEMKWTVLETKQVYERPWLNASRDIVKLPNGKIYDEFYILHYPDFVNVIAIDTDGQIILEQQYRHAIGKVSTELVAGCVEPGETPLEGAQRELLEETGYSGGSWTEIMTIAPNSGSADNLCHCFLAQGVKPTADRHLDETEDIEVFLKKPTEVYDMLLRGDFLQAMMVAPLWKYFYQNPIDR